MLKKILREISIHIKTTKNAASHAGDRPLEPHSEKRKLRFLFWLLGSFLNYLGMTFTFEKEREREREREQPIVGEGLGNECKSVREI